jgi:hypothetical protein
LNKRAQLVPIRARYPFVDGPLDGTSGLPLGPLAAPIFPTLPAGDILVQFIQVLMPNGSYETVKLRAEILQNMEVGTIAGDPRLGLALNPPPGDSEQGERIPVVRVRLATLQAGRDSLGREVSFPVQYASRGTGLHRPCALLRGRPVQRWLVLCQG